MKRYFFMNQDNSLGDSIGFRDFNINGQRHIFTYEDAEKINETTSLYLDETKGDCAPGFIKSPVYMVSDMVKQVLDMYEDDMIFKKIILIHKSEERQLAYFHLLLKQIDALHADTTFYPNGMAERLILSEEKIKQHNVFLMADYNIKLPVVSLEIVESLLRRHVIGIAFQEMEVR